MHYQHRYHAGNFADVFKHIVLLAAAEALCRKPAPWCYLESHAGAGVYDLSDQAAERTGEWRNGIGRLSATGAGGGLVDRYMEIVWQGNPDGEILRYPGSPLIASAACREQDRLVLCERVPEIAAQLREACRGDSRVQIHQRDGYELPALLPPSERRGLILIDPPYERPDEFRAVVDLARRCLARFAHGVCLVWYPVKQRHAADRLQRAAISLGRSGLDLRFDTGERSSGQMNGCGMLMLNAPYGVLDALKPALDHLRSRLGYAGSARWDVTEF